MPIIMVYGLVSNNGEGVATKREGGHMKFYPYKMGVAKSLSYAEGGHKKFWGSFYTVA